MQLYVHEENPVISRPEKELKDFVKVALQPGEEKELSFKLDFRSFAYYNTGLRDWHVESGKYQILIGASSADIRLKADYIIVYDNDYTINAQDKSVVADM